MPGGIQPAHHLAGVAKPSRFIHRDSDPYGDLGYTHRISLTAKF